MIANISVLAVIAVFTAWLAMKGTLARGLGVLFSVLIGTFVAFGFYEPLSAMLIEREYLKELAPAIVFAVLLIATSALLITLVYRLIDGEIKLGELIDKIGGGLAGALTGMVAAGALLIAVSLANIRPDVPYERFSGDIATTSRASKVLLNPDGVVAAVFGMVSTGSLAGDNSFSNLHACYIDQLAIGRIAKAKAISPTPRSSQAAAIPADGVRTAMAPDRLRDADGKRLEDKPGQKLLLVRAQIREKYLLGQLRLVVQDNSGTAGTTADSDKCIYPAGYMISSDSLMLANLSEVINPAGDGDIDLAFYIPSEMEPSLLLFKQGSASITGNVKDAREGLPVIGFKNTQESQKR